MIESVPFIHGVNDQEKPEKEELVPSNRTFLKKI